MIKGLAHICFQVRDLDAAIAFYRDKLGLTRAFDFINKNGQRYGVYLRAGRSTFVELFVGELAPAAERQSYRHCCFEVDDIQAEVARLRAAGVNVTDPILGEDHSWQAWLADPDGNRMELHQYTPKSWQTPHLG